MAMLKVFAGITCLSFMLVGCDDLPAGAYPTEENYYNIVKTWLGSNEDDLISKWGVPEDVYKSGRKKYLTYINKRTIYIQGRSPRYQTSVFGNTAYTNSYGGSKGYNLDKSCQTTFTVSKGVITNVAYKGNDCVALDRPS